VSAEATGSATTVEPPRLVLASASPARLATLRAAGIEPRVLVSGVDESLVAEPDAERLACRLAELKAGAVVDRLRGEEAPDRFVLGCDSVLAIDGQVLGKPVDADEARRRWQAMRGRSGVLHTGHCLIEPARSRQVSEVSSTVVSFADVADEEIARYVETGEPLQVAGAFTIDGLGAPFVERIDGDHGTVVGLSMPVLRRLLAALDLSITDLWRG
jgi:nucleoside triphosphate pyrophosphatase